VRVVPATAVAVTSVLDATGEGGHDREKANEEEEVA
jgi:hypothetical protein